MIPAIDRDLLCDGAGSRPDANRGLSSKRMPCVENYISARCPSSEAVLKITVYGEDSGGRACRHGM